MFIQSNFKVDYGKACYDNLIFSEADKRVLRGLASQVAEISARPVMSERKKLWTRHNDLKGTRPLILADPENGWNEIITPDNIQCLNNVAQYWEFYLRKLIFWADQLSDDFIVEPVFDLPLVYDETRWSIEGSELKATDKTYDEKGGAYHIDSILTDYSMIDRIRKPVLTIDQAKSQALLETAHEIFDGLLEVRSHTVWYWSLGMTDEYAFLRGMDKLMYDFYDEPECVHAVMEQLTQGMMEKIDFLEANGLYHLNNDWTYVGSGGIGYSSQLPADGFSGKVRTKDMWVLLESQITVGVSPAMFEEFIWPYQKRIADRFGLLCYGCCEPMDERFDIVRRASNLRRVSVSPWANKSIMSEKLGDSYIYSMKASPSPLALSSLDEELVRKEIRDALQIASGNHLEIIMKDNHTLGHQPLNLIRWTQIAKEEVERL